MNGGGQRNRQKERKSSIHAVVRGVDVLQEKYGKGEKRGYIIEQAEDGLIDMG